MSGIAALGLTRAAEILGKDKSTISRWHSGESAMEIKLEQFARLLHESGYKLVPLSYKCVNEQTYKSVWNLAREALKRDPDMDEDPE